MTELRWVVLLAVGWLAGTVSGAAGFGGALALLPALACAVGARAAVPVLTLAQLLGNLSRVGFGWREVRWRPALLFSAGAVPASLLGSRLFVALPPGLLPRVIGVFLLGVVALRHTPAVRRPVPANLLPLAGSVVGVLSGLTGSAGPLGAVVFLGLKLPATAYVATEAVTASLMHLGKSLVYGKYALLRPADVAGGLSLGVALAAGSWTGRKLIERLPAVGFDLLVEALLTLAALASLLGPA